MRTGVALIVSLATLAACSGGGDEPLVMYPEGAAAPTDDPTAPAKSTASPNAPAPPAREQPVVGQKILGTSIYLRDSTADGHLVFSSDADLVVLPSGATTPTTLVKDYDVAGDDLFVLGRVVGVWLGEDVRPSALTSWTASSGVRAGGPVSMRRSIVPKPGSDRFAYRGPTSSALASKVLVTEPGQGAGTLVVPSLDNGALEKQCKPTIDWVGSELLVAGCVGASTTPKIALYATDGSGATKTLLDGAAPGLWIDHAHARAIVQTPTASRIRSLTGPQSVSLDTRLSDAFFSADGALVVYLRADRKVRRASTSAPIAPVDLGTATELLGVSRDARWVAFATKHDNTARTDIVLVDANAPATPRVVAPEKAIFHGFTNDGSAMVYQTKEGLLGDGRLFVLSTAAGASPVEVGADARRIVFDGDVLYWQASDQATKSSVLRAVRPSAPSKIISIDQGFDPLTAHAARVGDKLWVASKDGLWVYPAVAP